VAQASCLCLKILVDTPACVSKFLWTQAPSPVSIGSWWTAGAPACVSKAFSAWVWITTGWSRHLCLRYSAIKCRALAPEVFSPGLR